MYNTRAATLHARYYAALKRVGLEMPHQLLAQAEEVTELSIQALEVHQIHLVGEHEQLHRNLHRRFSRIPGSRAQPVSANKLPLLKMCEKSSIQHLPTNIVFSPR